MQEFGFQVFSFFMIIVLRGDLSHKLLHDGYPEIKLTRVSIAQVTS